MENNMPSVLCGKFSIRNNNGGLFNSYKRKSNQPNQDLLSTACGRQLLKATEKIQWKHILRKKKKNKKIGKEKKNTSATCKNILERNRLF